jgi:hypothetical protein
MLNTPYIFEQKQKNGDVPSSRNVTMFDVWWGGGGGGGVNSVYFACILSLIARNKKNIVI